MVAFANENLLFISLIWKGEGPILRHSMARHVKGISKIELKSIMWTLAAALLDIFHSELGPLHRHINLGPEAHGDRTSCSPSLNTA